MTCSFVIQHVPFANIPFFWTMIFGKSLRYAGHCRGFDELHVEGDLDKGEFVAYYIKGDNVSQASHMHSMHTQTDTDRQAGRYGVDVCLCVCAD